MIIVTNDPFDSIGFGVEWLKSLGLTPDQIRSEPIRDVIGNMTGQVIIVHRVNGKPVSVSVFDASAPHREAIAAVLKRVDLN